MEVDKEGEEENRRPVEALEGGSKTSLKVSIRYIYFSSLDHFPSKQSKYEAKTM